MSDANPKRHYAIVTGAYWGFTLTDGALRMLVLLYFHTLGFTPLQLATLFLLYEVFGIITNLVGGWIGNRLGLNLTLYIGLGLQIVALITLSMLNPDWPRSLSVTYVLCAQGLSGIAKDFTKMSAKSSIKLLVKENAHSVLFKWVALLTGSKNTLKGLGFFVGAALLTAIGFTASLLLMAAALSLLLLLALILLPATSGATKHKTKFTHILAKSADINKLSAARMMLFGARDVWFVVALPLFLYEILNWTFHEVGAFMAFWIIGYGFVQGFTPNIIKRSQDGRHTEIQAARIGISLLSLIPIIMSMAYVYTPLSKDLIILPGLILFGVVFAVNSSVHSYLILAFSKSDTVSLDVGFYYMANAAGRLLGTILSGLCYQQGGIVACLLAAATMLALGSVLTFTLPRQAAVTAPETTS
ncbi:MAG: MFS transporter [Kordiimonas sp.]|nr:MFS transporter [Kordiimonas sp.]